MTEHPNLIIMPVLAGLELTEAAIGDCLAQSVHAQLLIINQGVDDDFRDRLEQIAEQYSSQVALWSHQPSLPSLAATWNRGLQYAWACGCTEALVINNDVRLHSDTLYALSSVMGHSEALFVSAVAVAPGQYDPRSALPAVLLTPPDDHGLGRPLNPGGPDFSCFLISQACHDRYPFDEGFTPAYCEDLDYHRRLLLAGEGDRIFSINVPYLHHAAGTLKSVDVAERNRINHAIGAGSRKYYEQKWGGPVNQETYREPFNAESAVTDGTAATPYLQHKGAGHGQAT